MTKDNRLINISKILEIEYDINYSLHLSWIKIGQFFSFPLHM